jgi:hypothetical protein
MNAAKILIVCILMVFSFSIFYAQTSDWSWAKRAGGTSYDYGRSIAVDTNGNTYVTGMFTGTISFDSISLTSSGNDIYVAKLSASGVWLWAKKAGGTGTDDGIAINVDSAGNAYLTGAFNSATATFGTISITRTGTSAYNDMFIAKIDTNGNWIWATKMGGTNTDTGIAITTDSNQNVYVGGSFRNTVTIATSPTATTLTCQGFSDVFVAKLNSAGAWLWAKRAGGMSYESCNAISVDANGNVYLAGGYNSDTCIFGTITMTNSTSETYDVYVAKLDTNGNWIWVKDGGGIGSDTAYGIKYLTDGHIVITGNIGSDASFGSSNLDCEGTYDVFVAALDNNGNWIWASKGGGAGTDIGWSLDSISNQEIWVIGEFCDTVTFGNYTLTGNSATVTDIFLAKIDGNGVWQSAKKVGGTGTDAGADVALDPLGNVYVIGDFTGTIVFGTTSLVSNSGSQDFFTAKMGNSALNLLSPVGGETWIAGSTHSITWAANNIASVFLDYSTDSGSSWTPITTDPITGSLGTYSWTVPATPCSTMKVRIWDYSNVTVFSVSPAVFSVYIPLILTAPNGGTGVSYAANSTQNITWTASNVSQVMLYFSLNGGQNWTSITANPISASLGTYAWTIPAVTSDQVKIKVADYANSNIFAISSSVFSIYIPITLTSMNGGAGVSYLAQSVQSITWTAVNVTQVLMDYSLNAGTTWSPIVTTPVPATPGSFAWTLPNLSCSQVKVRVRDYSNPNYFAASSSIFTIYIPLILQSPNGGSGVSFPINSTQSIIWNATNVNSVMLDYSVNGGNSWDPIVSTPVTASVGSYPWVIPNVISDQAKVRIVDAANPNIYAASEAFFAIYAPLVLNSLNAGGHYPVNSTQSIAWSAINVSNVLLDYSTDAGASWNPIISTSIPAAMGSYLWTLPEVECNLVKVRVRDAANANFYAISQTEFSIYVPLRLNTMNGGTGVIFAANSVQNIEWTAAYVNDVILDYSLDSGQSWLPIVETPIPANPGLYAWTLPNVYCSGAKIRVRDYLNQNSCVSSTHTFEIRLPLCLQSFCGGEGEAYAATSSHQVLWTSFNVENVNLRYSLDSGQNWLLINDDPICASSGCFDWELPNLTSHSVRVCVEDAGNSNVCSFSAQDFAIIVPPQEPTDIGAVPNATYNGDINISWNPVLTDINGNSMAPDGYKIYSCPMLSDDMDDYTLVGTVTSGSSFVHIGAAIANVKLFYRIVAFKN